MMVVSSDEASRFDISQTEVEVVIPIGVASGPSLGDDRPPSKPIAWEETMMLAKTLRKDASVLMDGQLASELMNLLILSTD